MAEYLPVYKPGQAPTLKASAAITGGQLCVVSGSGTVAPSSAATHNFVGVASDDAAVNGNVTFWCGGVQSLTAVGAITAGQLVEPAAGGGVAPHTNGTNDFNVYGLALTTAANGAKVRVRPLR